MSDTPRLQPMNQDGIFKMLTWKSHALTAMFNLPDISGDPLQQETHEPVELKLDRFYPLEDGSYLNVEHQTRLSDRNALAERMVKYRARARGQFPIPTILRQVVVYIGAGPKDRGLVPGSLDYDDRDPDGLSGIVFTAPVRDLLLVPLDTFRASGLTDDLLLGMLGPGRASPAYQEVVAERVRSLRGEEQHDAKVKFIAICFTLGVSVSQLVGDVRMWIEDVKDSPMIREVVEIAGRDRLDQERRRGLAMALVKAAETRGVDVPAGFVDDLTLYADVDQIQDMISEVVADPDALAGDLTNFVRERGVDLPKYGG